MNPNISKAIFPKKVKLIFSLIPFCEYVPGAGTLKNSQIQCYTSVILYLVFSDIPPPSLFHPFSMYNLIQFMRRCNGYIKHFKKAFLNTKTSSELCEIAPNNYPNSNPTELLLYLLV